MGIFTKLENLPRGNQVDIISGPLDTPEAAYIAGTLFGAIHAEVFKDCSQEETLEQADRFLPGTVESFIPDTAFLQGVQATLEKVGVRRV